MIDIYTKARFEFELENMCHKHKINWDENVKTVKEYEYIYEIHVPGTAVSMIVRSSVNPFSGLAHSSGDDSIRVYLIDELNDTPLMGKLQRWITRLPGWERRMGVHFDDFVKFAKMVQVCDFCHWQEHIYKVKKEGPNKGRFFKKCHCENSFEWITTDTLL